MVHRVGLVARPEARAMQPLLAARLVEMVEPNGKEWHEDRSPTTRPPRWWWWDGEGRVEGLTCTSAAAGGGSTVVIVSTLLGGKLDSLRLRLVRHHLCRGGGTRSSWRAGRFRHHRRTDR